MSPPTGVPPRPAGASAGSRISAGRRAGRILARALRPLALPFLHRFEWRVRTAVVKTGLPDAVARIEATLAAHTVNSAAAAAARHDLLQTMLQHLRTEATQLRELPRAELDVLRACCDGLDDAVQAAAELRDHSLAEYKAVRDRCDELAATLQTMAAARSDTEARLGQRLDAMWGGLSTRADMLLRRAVLPCGDAFLARTPAGWLLAPAADQKLLVALYESGGVLEPGTTAVVEGLLAPDAIVVDAGANIGLITLPAARRVGDTGHIIAVEPTPELVGLLRRSMALNDLEGRVVVHDCAAGEHAGRHGFNVAPARGHSSLLALDVVSERIEVDVRPLDDLVPAGTAVALVKLDVEGFELPAWRGMRRIIAESPELAVIVEFGPLHLARAGERIEDWLAALTAPGFTPYEIDELTGVCRRLRAYGLDQVFSMNLLLLRSPPERFPSVHFA